MACMPPHRHLATWMSRLLVTAALVALAPGAALAQQQGGAQAEDVRRAQQHFDRGAEFYFGGNYARAIVEFRKGHERHPNPLFLYNIALAQTKLGQYDEARATARRVDKEGAALPEKIRMQNRALIASTGRLLEARSVAEAVERAASTARKERDAKPAARTATVTAGAEAAAAEPQLQVQDGSDEGGFGALGWTGLGATVAGVGALVAGGLMTAQLADDWDAYETAAEQGDLATWTRLNKDIPQRQTTAQVLLYSGAGLTAAGVVMMVLSGGAQEEGDLTLGPAPTDGGMAVELGLDF